MNTAAMGRKFLGKKFFILTPGISEKGVGVSIFIVFTYNVKPSQELELLKYPPL